MPAVRDGAPSELDSRLRGNDGEQWAVITAKAGIGFARE
jgi:hypothetical protein